MQKGRIWPVVSEEEQAAERVEARDDWAKSVVPPTKLELKPPSKPVKKDAPSNNNILAFIIYAPSFKALNRWTDKKLPSHS